MTIPNSANLAFGSRRSLLDVIDMMDGPLDTLVECVHQPSRPGDVPHSADAPRLHILHPDVEPTPSEERLQATIDWFRTQ